MLLTSARTSRLNPLGAVLCDLPDWLEATDAARRRLPEPIGGTTSLLLSFGVPQGRFEAQIGRAKLTENFEDWPLVIDVQAHHFAFMAIKSKTRPTTVASPMLSLKH